MRLASLVSVLVMVAGLLSGCGDASSTQQPGFSSVAKGTGLPSGNTLPHLSVIRTEADWASFWDQLHASQSPKPALPPVNFAENVIVALVDEVRATGGYTVTITDIQRSPSGIVVVASHLSPGPACAVTAAFTQPFHLVMTPVFSGEASLQLSQSVSNCGQ